MASAYSSNFSIAILPPEFSWYIKAEIDSTLSDRICFFSKLEKDFVPVKAFFKRIFIFSVSNSMDSTGYGFKTIVPEGIDPSVYTRHERKFD